MPRTSADQCQQSPKLDRIGNPTAEDWAIAGCANLARARRAGGSARADYRSSLGFLAVDLRILWPSCIITSPASGEVHGARMTLYERYGGYDTFARIVESFYRAVLREESLEKYFRGVEMQRLMTHQTQFLAAALGGPVAYNGRTLADSHKRLQIRDQDFNLVAELLVEALEDGGMAPADIATVVEIVLGTREQIVAPAA